MVKVVQNNQQLTEGLAQQQERPRIQAAKSLFDPKCHAFSSSTSFRNEEIWYPCVLVSIFGNAVVWMFDMSKELLVVRIIFCFGRSVMVSFWQGDHHCPWWMQEVFLCPLFCSNVAR